MSPMFIFLWMFTTFVHQNSALQPSPIKSINPRIINGEQATLGQFPWEVSIDVYGVYAQWSCGGTIISEEWIVTAAHCIEESIRCTVYAGVVDLSILSNSTWSDAYTMEIHQGYNDRTLANDIALLKLEEPLVFSDIIKPIDLATEPLEANVDILISGWGLVSDDSSLSAVLNYGTVTTIDNVNCNDAYGQGIFNEMVCAVANGNIFQATCFGDNGGPAIVYNGDTPVLVAVSSFISDRGCESADPSGFVRVAYYRNWIGSITGV